MTAAQREGAHAALLVERAQAGDAAAFAELVRRYRRRIFALALHIARSQSDADDITQDVFIKAYQALPNFEGRSEFFTWVYRMTVNRALNAKRDRDRRGERVILDPRLELAVATDGKGDPRREAELRQTYTRLLHALDSLAVDLRMSVILVALQGLSHAEAAVVQKVSEGTISWRMHEARARLQKAMADGRVAKVRPLSSDLSQALSDNGLPGLLGSLQLVN
ncbi:MAG: sigma-70 family RNA polymerase sigma factor [Kofleriaceae bacterium]|nr:sigma-70 family RNA polymerase sigma factor [Kofleriaceae bacterium]